MSQQSTPPPSEKPVLDLRIRLDQERNVVSVLVNEVPVALPDNTSQAVEPESCCDSEASKPGEDPVAQGRQLLLNLLRNSLLTLFIVVAGQMLIYHLFLNHDDSFLSRYGWWVLYLDLSVVALVANLVYLRSYIYVNANHMVGMMIGMTIGMQVGTMIGGVLGATNGFFVGSIVGMSLGSLYGVMTAWCCGPMAVMHGLMAGVMGGTMGAMVVVMMIPDHVLIFMPIFTTANLLILMWFTYLFYKECVVSSHCHINKPISFPGMLTLTFLTVGLLSTLMVAGPKGPMVWKGHKRITQGDQTPSNPFSMKEGHKPGGVEDPVAGEMICGHMMSEEMDDDEE